MKQDQESFKDYVCRHDPLVSVVISVYNKAAYLGECIESFVNQTYQNCEIIVVDDGSSDRSVDVARQVAEQNVKANIKILNKPNGGANDARNFGLEHAQGRVVLTMDGDDKAKPTYLESAIEAFRQTGAEIFRPNQETFGSFSEVWEPRAYDRFAIRYDNCFPTPSIFDRELFLKTGGFKRYLGYAEDWEFWLHCSRFNPLVVQSSDVLTMWRATESGLAAELVEGKWEVNIAVVVIEHQDFYPVEEVLSAHNNITKTPQENVQYMCKLYELYPNEWFLKFYFGILAQSENNLEQAEVLYEQSISLSDEKNWQPMYRLAQVFQMQGRAQLGEPLLEEVRVLRPDMRKHVDPLLDQISGGTSKRLSE